MSIVDVVGFDVDDGDELSQDVELYQFEGEGVARTKGKVTSAANLEVGDQVFKVDEVVRLVIEARVAGVDHRVANDGKIERVHTLKVFDATVIDWDVDLARLKVP